MDWLAPATGLIAAAVAVPALVILYLLKLRRREMLVSSTLLWRRAVQDLRVNAPFQRMRWNVLFLLQLLALAALVVALARPVLSLATGEARRYVILVDRSASMNSTDVRPTRLAEAKRQAKALVESLREGRSWYLASESDQAMVIAFADRAKVLSNYTSDKAQLEAAVDAVEPTDGRSLLAEALTVARAFATPAGTEDKGRSAESPAALELFSDGRIADLGEIALAPGELTFHKVGSSGANVAITAMQARRSYEDPDRLEVFANLANFGGEPVECEVALSIDATVRGMRPVAIPPREAGRASEPDKPGQAAVSFQLAEPGAGALEVRVVHAPGGGGSGQADVLASDDATWAILEPPRRLTAALVTEGNEPLRLALRACPLARLDVLEPAAFEQAVRSAGDVSPWGLVVLDRCAPDDLPRGNYLVFGRPPAASGARAEGELENQSVVDWQDKHPVLNFVNLENLFAATCWKLDLPRDAVVLAEFEDTPALAMVRRRGGIFLLAGFDALKSNWPFDAGFVMFCYNASAFAGSESGDAGRESLAVGDPVTLQAAPGLQRAEVQAPGRAPETIESDPSGMFRYARTTRAGVYRLIPGGAAAAPKDVPAAEAGPEKQFAVNLFDSSESRVEPAAELVAAGQVVEATETQTGPANREVWPLLVGLCLALVAVEWYVYNRKARL